MHVYFAFGFYVIAELLRGDPFAELARSLSVSRSSAKALVYATVYGGGRRAAAKALRGSVQSESAVAMGASDSSAGAVLFDDADALLGDDDGAGDGEDASDEDSADVDDASDVANNESRATAAIDSGGVSDKVSNSSSLLGRSGSRTKRRRRADFSQAELAQAERAQQAVRERFSSLLAWCARVPREARRDGGVVRTALLARPRLVPALLARGRSERAVGERQAINAVVQGTAAELFKSVLLRVRHALRAAAPALQARIVMPLHDELLLEVRPGDEEALARLLRRTMCVRISAATPPLPITIRAGSTWADLQPLLL